MVFFFGYYKVMSNIPKMGQLPTPEVPLMVAGLLIEWEDVEDDLGVFC